MEQIKGNINFRDEVPEDREAIQKILDAAWLETYPNKEAGISKEDIEDFISRPRKRSGNNPEVISSKTLIAEIDGKVVGFARGTIRKNENKLQAIYIDPQFQRLRIGNGLWKQLTTAFYDQEKDIIVDVAPYNIQAINAYKKWGFEETGEDVTEERFRLKSGAIIPQTRLILKR